MAISIKNGSPEVLGPLIAAGSISVVSVVNTFATLLFLSTGLRRIHTRWLLSIVTLALNWFSIKAAAMKELDLERSTEKSLNNILRRRIEYEKALVSFLIVMAVVSFEW